jgi:serine/threonine protein kinase
LDGNTEQSEDLNVPLYFVMEFIEGKTLADVVTNGRNLSPKVGFGIALDLCATLRIAIREGIVHRDIKPENIIVRSCDPADAVMIDFGLSFNEDDASNLTDTEESLDNKFLSLPERRGPGENRRDPRSDLTSICAILYFCLTKCAPRNLRDSQGRAPHQWSNYLRSKQIQNVPQRAELDLLFSRGLSYEIDSRFQSIEELTGRLQYILQPSASGVIEDLDAVLTREMAAIRRVDRTTQLSDYYQNVWTLQQPMTDHLNNVISNKLSKYRTFYVRENNHQGFEKLNERSDVGDLFARRIFGVTLNNHPHAVQVHYSFVAQGPECIVYREIKEGSLGEKGKPLDPVVTVFRYEGNSEPDKQVMLKDMDAAVARSITLLSQKIQSLSLQNSG